MEWNGECSQLQLTRIAGAVLQGWASYCVSRALISLQRLYEKVQCMLPAFFLVWHHDVRTRGVPGDQPAPCIGATLTTAKEGCY